jgi:hypothetical protein
MASPHKMGQAGDTTSLVVFIASTFLQKRRDGTAPGFQHRWPE